MVTGIRDYVHGDAFNRISWNASARLGRLMVKEFDIDPTSDLWVVLDLDARYKIAGDLPVTGGNGALPPLEAWLDSTEEYGVAVVSSLARFALDQGRAVGLIATGAHHEVIPAERSDRAYIKMLEALAVVRSDGQRSLAEVLVAEARRFNRNSGVVVVTASTDPLWVDAVSMIATRRIQTSVVFIEGASFDRDLAADSRPVLESLLRNRIRTHIVHAGARLDEALRTPIV
jgi:uncharacterized protein (DUF58 family)